MAGASMNDIKARIKSVNGTMQITKAMELVATSKLRLAKQHSEATIRYAKVVGEAMQRIALSAECSSLPWLRPNSGGKDLYIVIAGDRGLAGGFNSNIFKLAKSLDSEADSLYFPIGKKAFDYYKRRGKDIYDDSIPFTEDASVGDGLKVAEKIAADYLAGRIRSVTVIYTEFVSMLTQTPTSLKILPIECSGSCSQDFEPIFEGSPEEFLASVVTDYMGGRIFSAACESYASELAARRTAMNSANKNAEEMIGSLMLKFNRARQAVITQEITEIVSGAEAL